MKWDRERQLERSRYTRERKRETCMYLIDVMLMKVPVMRRMMLSIMYEYLEGKEEET